MSRESLLRDVLEAFDVHYGDDSHVACGDRWVSGWTLAGTTSDGERIAVRGCGLWTFRGEEIVRTDSFWKMVEP